MIKINDQLSISEKEIQFDAIRASGPGGQHVNKSSTAIQLKFDLNTSSLTNDILTRLRVIAGSHLSTNDVIIIKAQNHRSQKMNKTDALDRLLRMIVQAAIKPKIRRQTRVPIKEKEKRMRNKRHQSQKKEFRKYPNVEND